MSIEIKITKAAQTKIHQVDFANIPFGRIFSDHMFIADYSDGVWHDIRIVPFGHLPMHPATSALHYGQSIFEGLKAFKGADGEALLFRPEKNWERMCKSAVRMAMPQIPHDLFMDGITELLKIDAQWVPNSQDSSLYIRPYMFATDEYVGIKASENYKFVIFACPVQSYYSHPVKVLVSEKYTRAFPGGTGSAKTSGNYAATLEPVNQARAMGFDQILWTDGYEHKYLQEIGTMNVMVHIGDTIITPKASGTILDGVTRDSVLTLLKDSGIKVEERDITIDEVLEAYNNGTLKDMFGTGTAATVSQISHFGYQGKEYALPNPEEREISLKVGGMLDDIKHGRVADTHNWLYKVASNTAVELK